VLTTRNAIIMWDYSYYYYLLCCYFLTAFICYYYLYLRNYSQNVTIWIQPSLFSLVLFRDSVKYARNENNSVDAMRNEADFIFSRTSSNASNWQVFYYLLFKRQLNLYSYYVLLILSPQSSCLFKKLICSVFRKIVT